MPWETVSKALLEVDYIQSLSLIHWVGHLLIKGDEVGQVGPVFPTPRLGGSDPLVVLYVLHDGTQLSKKFCAITFSSTEIKLTGLLFLGFPFQPFFVDECHVDQPPSHWNLPS